MQWFGTWEKHLVPNFHCSRQNKTVLVIQTRLSGKQTLFQGTSPDLTGFKDRPERQNMYLGATGKVELTTSRLYFFTLFFFFSNIYCSF